MLSNLDGPRSEASAVYERFVRVQRVPGDHVVNGVSSPFRNRLVPRYLVSAAPPFSVDDTFVDSPETLVSDSAFIEVRTGDVAWRFALQVDWQRDTNAGRGINILFNRNPRALDTPLPVGVSCNEFVACGAISLRRLPPPVTHVSLDHAGFDPARFGLLGQLVLAEDGYEVVLPRESYRVERGAAHPVAIPVTPLTTESADGDVSRWILLRAAGEADDLWRVGFIAAGLWLLLLSISYGVGAVTIQGAKPPTLGQERALAVGLTALLGLALTRVTIGARVAFFDPFEPRGIETAVGLFTAVAVVIAGLLTWSAWLPPFLAGARTALSGRMPFPPLSDLSERVAEWERQFSIRRIPTTVWLGIFALLFLTLSTTGSAPLRGAGIGAMVLLAWVGIAWVCAFTGTYFDTYEHGAHSVIEQSPPSSPGFLSAPGLAGGRRRHAAAPEWTLIVAVLFLAGTHLVGLLLGLIVPVIVIMVASVVIWRRRRRGHRFGQPDYLAAALGVSVIGAAIASLHRVSENGAAGALLLVVIFALASVRIGRRVGARLETQSGAGGAGEVSLLRRICRWLEDPILLATPLLLMIPLAAIDMGLVLVVVIPLGSATLLATSIRAARSRALIPAAGIAILSLIGLQVLYPFSSLEAIRDARSHAEQAEAFAKLSTIAGLRLPLLAEPMERAAARSIATYDQDLAEALLVAAAPGEARDLLRPSIEQIWGARAYASAGLTGEGLGQAAIGGRGVAEAVSYAENTFSVFVLAEHGMVGGLLVLALYALLGLGVASLILGKPGDTPSYRASRALFLVAGLIVVIPAFYVALSNVGAVPITGQNMPFLGLNSWSDVVVCSGVVGILITGALRAYRV